LLRLNPPLPLIEEAFLAEAVDGRELRTNPQSPAFAN